MWTIPASDVEKYEAIFDQLAPVNNKLDGTKCKPVMLKSQLSTETLGRIWDLADIDDDGCLDKSEFVLALYLCQRCSEGDMLPDSLPQSLIPPGKESFVSRASSFFHDTDPFAQLGSQPALSVVPLPKSNWSELSVVPFGITQSASPASFGQMMGPTTLFNYPPWVISAEELAKSNSVFNTIDSDADGLVTGPEVREVLIRSGLPQPILAQIWNLVDIHGTGSLNCEQFAVAMHLATDQLSSSPYSRTLPAILPAALVPPSLRPISPDPAMFEESNRLIAEIEAINRERLEVENSSIALSTETQHRATESASIQRRLDTLSHTSRSLMNQRSEAERRLSDYSHEKATLETMLTELKSHINEERSRVEELRSPINNQQEAAKKEAVDRLRLELNELIREVSQLQDRVAEKQRRLQQIEAENRGTQDRIEKASNHIQSLQSVRGQLHQVLDQYDGALNGSSSLEIDESKVLALLNDQHRNGTAYSPKDGFGVKFGESNVNWPAIGSDALSRIPGSSSVPLPVMHSSRFTSGTDSSDPFGPAVATPLALDPFQGIDPFAMDSNAKPEKGFKDDPFAPVGLFPASDPFGGVDPFGTDPFNPVGEKSVTFLSDKTSAFDPFTNSTINHPSVPASGITDGDFDAIFNTKPADVKNTDDPFGVDPFTSMEQKALTTEESSRRSPPPRPTLQPGAGRLARKTTGTSGSRSSRLTSARSIGSLPTAARSNSLSTSTGYNTISPGSSKVPLMSKLRPNSKDKTRSADQSGSWNPTGLSEAEQLSLATLESERLAQLEERARQQEEAELQLAIRLSQMETRSS